MAEDAGVSRTTVRRLEREALARCLFRTRGLVAYALGTHPNVTRHLL
ncbi:MAG: hypothetical protein M3Y33_20780 [Actinomycetota bacterium]|nr:hypothetical protein [Actinomycetota bacterium]